MPIIKNDLAQLLFEFVERVVKKGATPEEVKVLPEMARLLPLVPSISAPSWTKSNRRLRKSWPAVARKT